MQEREQGLEVSILGLKLVLTLLLPASPGNPSVVRAEKAAWSSGNDFVVFLLGQGIRELGTSRSRGLHLTQLSICPEWPIRPPHTKERAAEAAVLSWLAPGRASAWTLW